MLFCIPTGTLQPARDASIYRLAAIFENSIFLRFYRYDFIREGRESDCKIEGVAFCRQNRKSPLFI